jgi:hypothetical protein
MNERSAILCSGHVCVFRTTSSRTTQFACTSLQRLCLGWRAWRRPRVRRTATQLRRVGSAALPFRRVVGGASGGRRLWCDAGCGWCPGRVLVDDESRTPSATRGLSAELDSGSVIALVVCVAVVPGRTKHVRTSCAGAGFLLCLSGAFPNALLSGVSGCKHAYIGLNMDGSRDRMDSVNGVSRKSMSSTACPRLSQHDAAHCQPENMRRNRPALKPRPRCRMHRVTFGCCN